MMLLSSSALWWGTVSTAIEAKEFAFALWCLLKEIVQLGT